MAILMISSSRGGHIGFFLIEEGPGPLAPLAKPKVIESKYMSLSQIQKELLPFLCFHEVATAILDIVYWKLLGAQVPPSTSGYADGHRVQIYVSVTNT